MTLCACNCGGRVGLYVDRHRDRGYAPGTPTRFLKGHNRRKNGLPFCINQETGCWEWSRAKQPSGYGEIRLANQTFYAHRVMYQLFRGKIPKGKELDHLCRNRPCVHPLHLEIVTHGENARRAWKAKKEI